VCAVADPTASLSFPLDVDDDWPPVAVESLPFAVTSRGYRALVAPLFVRDLSVGDVIAAEFDGEGRVRSWHHLERSRHTTVWLLRTDSRTATIPSVLEALRTIGCATVTLQRFGCHAIDVPPTLPIQRVDALLEGLDESAVAVAFPSMRHPE
jgi:hypothetical protein